MKKDDKPRLVHRIDKDTSGVLLLARNRKYAELLTKAFREHRLPKTYLALTVGVPHENYGEIRAPLAKSGEKMVVRPDGQPSRTLYRVLDNAGGHFALLEVSPLTGRTHQIRAHLESIGCPIAGDDRYFGPVRQKFDLFADKLHLHAYKIDLSAIYNKQTVIEAPLPDYFAADMQAVGLGLKI